MNSVQFGELIKLECKKRHIKIGDLLESCDLNKGFLSDLSRKNKTTSVDNALKIAEYLEVSVDYLLGKTDNPKLINSSYKNILNSPFNNQLAEGSKFEFNDSSQSQQISDNKELTELINQLSLVERSEIIVMINDMIKKKST